MDHDPTANIAAARVLAKQPMRWRFSLKTLMVALAMFAIGCSVYRITMRVDHGRFLILRHGGECTDFSGGRSVFLSGSQAFTDADLFHIVSDQIVVLDLANTGVTDAGLKHLATCRKLQELNVTGTRVTEAGVSGFTRSRPRCLVRH